MDLQPDLTVSLQSVNFNIDVNTYAEQIDMNNALVLTTKIQNLLATNDSDYKNKNFLQKSTALTFINTHSDKVTIEEFIAILCPATNLFKNFMSHIYSQQYQQVQSNSMYANLNNVLSQMSFTMTTMCQSINRLALNMPNSSSKKVKISQNPPKYNWKTHNSMRSFGSHEFARWALAQSLTDKESTLFFCLCFDDKLQCDHIDSLARNPNDGSAKFNTVLSLIEKVIDELGFKEESSAMLQHKFVNFKILKGESLQYQFLRLSELRKMGWPSEEQDASLKESKEKFLMSLDLHDNMHNTIYVKSNMTEWKDASTTYAVSTVIRDIVQRFDKMPITLPSSNRTPSSRNSNPMPSNAMDTSNNMSESVNAVQIKCRYSKCQKSFSPAQPYFKYCSGACRKNDKSQQTSTDNQSSTNANANQNQSSSRRSNGRRAKRYLNNIEQENNSAGSDLEVGNKKFYKCQMIIDSLDNTDIPTIVYDSLFDMGSGPSLVMKKCLEKWGLSKYIKHVPNDTVINGGDSSPMKGMIGYITLPVSLEDTLLNSTKSINHEFLVFENLNHDVIIGQDLMYAACSRFVCYPAIDTILINPSTKAMNSQMKKVTDQRKKAVNNIKNNIKNITKSSPNSEKIPTMSIQTSNKSYIQKFDDNETYFLNVPMSNYNKKKFTCNNVQIQGIAAKFMDNLEDSYSSLSDILTEGGLDGTIDKSTVNASDTKKLSTDKGEVTVGNTISKDMERQFSDYISNYKGNVFDSKTLGKTRQQAHLEIKTDAPSKPPPAKYMPLNPYMRAEAKKLVEKMVDLGVLEPTTKKANCTIFIIQKVSGKWRLICDLKQYNDRLQDYVVHLPSPYELINQICQYELFSYCDFPEAYFNIPLSKETLRNNPIVASVSGLQQNYQYLRMPQGMKTSTSTFIHILNDIYQDILHYLFLYLDDSVLCSEDNEKLHFDRLKTFFDITEKAGLRIALAKSVFFTKNLTFLNFTVANKRWSLSDSQKTIIRSLNTENLNADKRESLAAFIQFFNKFDTGVAYAARKIRDPKTDAKIVDNILDNIKSKLINSPALNAVDFKSDLHVFCDASKDEASAVIFQKDKKSGKYSLVSCFSRKLPESIVNKDIYSKELWCLHQVKSKFRYLFIGDHRKVFYIDNKAVLAAEKSKSASLRCLFDSIKVEFSNVNFKYVQSKKNASDIFTRSSTNCIRKSSRIQEIKNAKITPQIRDKILKVHSNAGCIPADTIHNTMKEMGYTFLNLIDIEKIIKECKDCPLIENHKKPRKSAPGITLARELTCQDCVFIDHKKVMTKARLDDLNDNHDYIPEDDDCKGCLTVFEPVSGLVWFFPVQDYGEESVKVALRLYFMMFGVTSAVVSDNAKTFNGSLVSWLEKEYSTKHHNTSVYHPNSNLSERFHAEFEKVLKVYKQELKAYNYKNWMECMAKACIARNSLKNQTTNLSPYEVAKNRVQNDIEPVKFHPTGFEHQVKNKKFNNKVDRIMKSRLKIRLPVFHKNQEVKIAFPDQEVKFGKVTSTKDTAFKMSVRVKINGEKTAFPVNKDHICIPKNQ